MACTGFKKTLLIQLPGKDWCQGIVYPEAKLEGMETVFRSSLTMIPVARDSAQVLLLVASCIFLLILFFIVVVVMIIILI